MNTCMYMLCQMWCFSDAKGVHQASTLLCPNFVLNMNFYMLYTDTCMYMYLHDID